MYIDIVPNRSSPPAILLRESYRDQGKVKKRTLANLSKLPADLIERIRQVLVAPAATATEAVCGAIFGVLPIITFRRKGGVAKGESYMKTTVLVNTGIYAIVRHPQGGTAWLLINLAAMLIAQHWSSVILGLASLVLVYADTFKADQYCIEKFGDDYRRYMERVPRVSFVAGIIRLLRGRD